MPELTDCPLIRVTDLRREFAVVAQPAARLAGGRRAAVIRAVDGLSFTIGRAETFSLVGESGCGKSTVARMLAGLLRPTAGRIEIAGVDLWASRDRAADRALRRRLHVVFQNVSGSLDPRWRVGAIIAEPLRAFALCRSAGERGERVAALLTAVGLDPGCAERFPHAFSSGQRQRIAIARAIAGDPEFLICDEPTAALDVSAQAQILNLLQELQRRLRLSMLLISHNLAVAAQASDVIGVVYLGRFCEVAATADLLAAPLHPYTRQLLDSAPDPTRIGRQRAPIVGDPPDPFAPPEGCSFHPRCRWASFRCRHETPELRRVGMAWVACHAVEEGRIG